jgi:23S rRNA (guanosine2251-2'-O)-methyltransferase
MKSAFRHGQKKSSHQSFRKSENKFAPKSRGRSNENSNLPAAKRVVIGIHSAREAIKVRAKKIKEVWLKIGGDNQHELNEFAEFAKSQNIKLKLQPESELNKIATSHQGVALFVDETPEFDFHILESLSETEKFIILAMDEVTDPHNIGAALRTAWLMGAKALILPKLRSGGLTPATIKVACGGAEHVPLVSVDNLQYDLKHLKDKGFWIYGLDGEAKNTLYKTKFHEKVVLVVGSEDKGLRSTTRNICDELVAIPQTESGASLNASVATAVALYEVIRQHATNDIKFNIKQQTP